MLDRQKIMQMKEQLKTGVRVVSAPSLFPTPPSLAERLIQLADIRPGHKVLEPSAGTGRILDAISQNCVLLEHGDWVAVELNLDLARVLAARYHWFKVVQEDFLQFSGRFDRIVMNPPFENGADIKHIQHAFSLLNPGGRLVAICAGGPRQRRVFEDYWHEDLPPGTFADEGTSVNCGVVIMDRRA
jgi:phospholipid N-methyltransferase